MKEEKLRKFISSLVDDGVVVAFSGGVDSTLILKVAKEEAEKKNKEIIAATFETFLSPSGDLDITRKLASDYKVRHIEKYIDQTSNENVLMNTSNRCFYCKKEIFKRAIEIAKENNMKYVLDGTNLSDLDVYRPGLKALEELKIISPLKECGFEKSDVRDLAKKLNISVAKRPSAPCLATRFPYNEKLPLDKFEMIDKGEDVLKSYGFEVCRIRLYKDITRIEILESEFLKFIEKKEDIIRDLKDLGFKYINLDMEGFRSGSMDEVINER